MAHDLKNRVAAATVEQCVDVVARAALRARPEDGASVAALAEALAALDVRCAEWLEAIRTCIHGAREELALGALDGVLGRVAELTDLLVRGAAPGIAPEPLRTDAGGAEALADDDFIDFSAGSVDHAGIIGEDEASTVDLRSLPTFETEARDHLDRADVEVLALEACPTNEEALNALFRCMHTLKGSSAIVGITPVKELAHEAEQILELARAQKIRIEGATFDVLFETIDELRRLVTAAAAEANAGKALTVRPDERLLGALRCIVSSAESGAVPRIGELLTAMGAASAETVATAAARQATAGDSRPPLGALLVREHGVDARQVKQALRLQNSVRSVGAAAGAETVRVDAERLDRFVDAIGELVIAESMVVHSPDLRASPLFAKLARPIGQLDKIARTLQEM